MLSFRLYRIGLSADISKIFREVFLHHADRDYHRFLFENDGEVQDWRMKRLTFGVNCSPFLQHKCSVNGQRTAPQNSQRLLNPFSNLSMWMISGADSFEDASKLRQSLNLLLERGREWHYASGDPILLPFETLFLYKTLGIHWNTTTDTLHVATPTLHPDDSPTKRQVLSDIARTFFDSLGWFSQTTIQLKILLQRTWMLGLEWDHVLPDDLVSIWRQWWEELPLVTNHPISRKYFNPE